MILFTALLNYLAEISASWQLPPLTQLRMLQGIHSTEYKQAIFLKIRYVLLTFTYRKRCFINTLNKKDLLRHCTPFLFKMFLL